MNIRNQLKAYMDQHGLTARQLSLKAKVPNSTIADWLEGRKPRNIDQLKRVADVFRISLDHLLFGEMSTDEIEVGNQIDGKGDWQHGLFEVKFRKVGKRV